MLSLTKKGSNSHQNAKTHPQEARFCPHLLQISWVLRGIFMPLRMANLNLSQFKKAQRLIRSADGCDFASLSFYLSMAIRSTSKSLSFNLLTNDSSGDAATFIHSMISDLAHDDAASQDPPLLSIHKRRRRRNKGSKKTSSSLPSPVDRNGPHVDGFESHCNGQSICDPLISRTRTAVKIVVSILQVMVFNAEKFCDLTEAFGMYEEGSGCITPKSIIDAVFWLHVVFTRVEYCGCLLRTKHHTCHITPFNTIQYTHKRESKHALSLRYLNELSLVVCCVLTSLPPPPLMI
ncbi:uncharacterized protein LOC131225935 [Magnolia sinica]|uniref:uncharacterized protein LOC131225935 n=1 Tax=Magnolia sinica TaxID=86752 RepID=UPI00265A1BCB|nr:uncharacterized protein LOC131225935 [Magnolia sinica]